MWNGEIVFIVFDSLSLFYSLYVVKNKLIETIAIYRD